MQRLLLLIFLSALTQFAHAQFMKVVDPDGFVNVREEPNAQSKITGKVNTQDIVYHLEADESRGNWISVMGSLDNEALQGYIHSSRLKPLNQLRTIPFVGSAGNVWHFKGGREDGFSKAMDVRIEFEMSNPEKLKSELKVDENGNFLLGEEHVWGLYDPSVKVRKYKSIGVEVDAVRRDVPAVELGNLFAVGYHTQGDSYPPMEVTYDADSDRLYLRSLNGDASYAYDLLFIFEKGKFKKKMVFIPF